MVLSCVVFGCLFKKVFYFLVHCLAAWGLVGLVFGFGLGSGLGWLAGWYIVEGWPRLDVGWLAYHW